LRQYYQDVGADDLVLFSFEKGSYVPIFRMLPLSDAPPAAEEPRILNTRTVAVLPFLNLSPDPDQDYFCDGITEEILTALTSVPELNVVARTSVFFFKGRNIDVREIGERLGAGTVIEGSVRKAAGNLRISAKAINASTGLSLWSGTYDREMADVFGVQSEIADAVANSLRPSPAANVEGFTGVGKAGNLEAYTLYLKGRHYWHQMSQNGTQEALSHFNRAVSLFPDYAPAYAGLADAYTHLTFWGAISPAEGTPRAKRAALEALRLDEGMAEPRAALGAIVSCFDWNWEEGARLIERALALQPSNLNAHNFYAFQFVCRGRFAEAMVSIEKSLQLDPLSPRVSRAKGWAFYLEHKFDQAIDSLKLALALDKRNNEARFVLGCAYLRKSLFAEAAAEFLDLPEGPFSATKWGALGEVYACWGKTGKARDAMRRLDTLAETVYVSPISRASVFAGLRDWDRMFEALEQAYAERCPWLSMLKVEPRYDPVRADPRLMSLLERIRLV
jgi:serine/threonine-protein kinase